MTQRLDAQRNYAAILQAARKVFSEHSPAAPLQLVAEEAKVGRGTLYRHFPNRTSLIAALYEDRLQRYSDYAQANSTDPDLLFKLLRIVAFDQIAIPGLFRAINAEMDSHEHIAMLWQRTQETFALPLKVAKESGSIHPEVDLRDLFLAIAMLYGIANSPRTFEHDEHIVDRALEILRFGLGHVS